MEETANTLSYFAAGYAVIFGVLLTYLVSLFVRWRNLREEEKILSTMENPESN